jgi:hypothetical protein
MPEGSNTCAVDSANKLVYSIEYPYPLMKYSIATDKWTTIKDLGIGVVRFQCKEMASLLFRIKYNI